MQADVRSEIAAERRRVVEEARAAVEHHKKHHPNYVVIGIWLFIITVVEVAVVFMPIGLWPIVVSLFVLMALKALGVLGYYMHLFSDAKTFSLLMGGGLAIAIAMLLSFGALFSVLPGMDPIFT